MPTYNKHIFVRPKKVCLLWERCLFAERVLILSSGGFRILGIVYTVVTLVLESDFLFTTGNEDQKLPKKHQKQSWTTHFFKNSKKYRLLISPKSSSFPYKHIFVRAKRVCLLRETCLLWVCLLWEGTVSRNGLVQSFLLELRLFINPEISCFLSLSNVLTVVFSRT